MKRGTKKSGARRAEALGTPERPRCRDPGLEAVVARSQNGRRRTEVTVVNRAVGVKVLPEGDTAARCEDTITVVY